VAGRRSEFSCVRISTTPGKARLRHVDAQRGHAQSVRPVLRQQAFHGHLAGMARGAVTLSEASGAALLPSRVHRLSPLHTTSPAEDAKRGPPQGEVSNTSVSASRRCTPPAAVRREAVAAKPPCALGDRAARNTASSRRAAGNGFAGFQAPAGSRRRPRQADRFGPVVRTPAATHADTTANSNEARSRN
jgi:hypothetical protein